MSFFARYFGRLIAWGGAVVLLQILSGGMRSFGELTGIYATLALVIGAFPAGAAVWSEVFPDRRFSPRGFGMALAAGAMASLLYFLFIGYLGPALATEGMASLSNSELRSAAAAATATAEALGPQTVEAWMEANRMAVHYVRRTDGAALPMIFTLLGVLSGFWATQLRSVPWQRVQLWGMGVFLLMTTYLAGENGHELVVAQSAGPAAFVGAFVLIVPGALLIGMGWAALAQTWWGARPD